MSLKRNKKKIVGTQMVIMYILIILLILLLWDFCKAARAQFISKITFVAKKTKKQKIKIISKVVKTKLNCVKHRKNFEVKKT